MAVYLTAAAAVGGDPAQLTAAADTLTGISTAIDEQALATQRAVDSTRDFWSGPASNAYRARGQQQVTTLMDLPQPVTDTATAYRTLAAELAAAIAKADAAMRRSVAIGMGEGDLVGRPFSVMAFMLTHPQHFGTVSQLLGEVVSARSQANKARDEFVASMGKVRGRITGDTDGWRGSDERGGRRQRNDEIFRRGGDQGGGHFDNDWAGRAILERYLRGGDDWTITDDERWSEYMMDNQQLREQLTGPAQEEAQRALQNYLSGNGSTSNFSNRFPAEIQNGEGIVGYQYLHGTNAEAGDFQFRGNSTVQPRADGNYEVTINGRYTWNDVIDPNPQYDTDTWKSRLAEVVTLGQADPYDIHITWGGQSKVVLAPDGSVVSIEGYPAP